ncbi:hypothetical protein [Muricauda sp. MAR_2010_75]|uniref:hypothetical protein n=1 Tax=Allomuricauda sp. MAR_2010_75 TaxID=1250232 RepID=UPI00056BBB46|nr:hypothetical protein [Muricauda sp. MAR_2010_75]
MNHLFTYDVSEKVEISNEVLRGIVISCGASTAGDTLAAINDLRHIDVELTIERGSGRVETIHSGHLDEILTGLYAQSVEYALSKKGFGLDYRFLIDFGGTVALRGNDKMYLRLEARSAAFTSIDTGKAASKVKAFTIASNGNPKNVIACTRSYAIANGNVDIAMDLKDNVHQIVAALDFTATYTASAKAKFAGDIVVTGTDISGTKSFKQALPKEAVETDNIFMFDDNPESSVAQLVVFRAKDQLLHNARLTGRLSAPADQFARIIVKHFMKV